tara:strand:- start:519 stop:737 length:219 start_codon:yes stop_codon:yes gene_type:complete
MNIDIAKPCGHIRQMDRYYVSSARPRWSVIDSTTELPVYDSAQDGQDLPMIFDSWDAADEARDNLNKEKHEA